MQNVNFEELARSSDDFNGAQLKARNFQIYPTLDGADDTRCTRAGCVRRGRHVGAPARGDDSRARGLCRGDLRRASQEEDHPQLLRVRLRLEVMEISVMELRTKKGVEWRRWLTAACWSAAVVYPRRAADARMVGMDATA